MKRLITFDLDGTLLNTVADLAQSTNYALQQLGFPAHEEKSYNLMVGNGINKLFERALPPGSKNEENINKVRDIFLPHYSNHNMDKTTPYPGIPELLITLHHSGFLLAIASNKYQDATEKLISHYFPHIPFIAVFGMRNGIPPKPDPTIINDILRIARVDKKEVLFIGDSGVDMQTAINSGVTSCGVTWGFRPESELRKYNPGHLVNKPQEIRSILSI